MRISDSTIEVFKNFSNINNSLTIRPGNVITVRNIAGDVQAAALIEEEFPRQFSINDVTRLISLLSTFDGHEIDFQENHMVIVSGNSSASVTYGNPEAIATTRRAVIPAIPEGFVFEGTFSTDQLEVVRKRSKILMAPTISFVAEDGTFKIVCSNLNDKSSNKAFEVISECPADVRFSMDYRPDVLNLLPGTYSFYVIVSGESHQTLFRNDSQAYAIGPGFGSFFNKE